MCQICIEFQKGKMTLIEAYRNQEEMNPSDKHSQEVLDMLNDNLYDEVFNLNGSDYQELKNNIDDIDDEDMQRPEDVDPLFWYDDLLMWQDY